MTDEELKEKIIRHDYEFKALTSSLSELSSNMKELTESLKHIAVINEKLFNMDKELKESFQRVHKRADEIEAEIKELELVKILVKYPKITLFMVVGAYVMTFDSVRKTIFGG